MDPEQLFNDLESNNLTKYEETKKTLAEYFNQTKDQWLVQGMMEYYLRTKSVRILEVLVKAQQPHDKYVFDRLSDWIRGHNKLQALSLLSFIIRKHPTWLYKVEKHALIRDVLKLMQTEKEIVPLMSALLCIITLLPIIPSLVPSFLQDLFEVFGHLASWNCQPTTKSPTPKTESQLIHLQIGLYMLFHRLYGMYPCNFMHYLRQEFSIKEKNAIFQHTIKPLLQSVRIHPLLVTSTRDQEVDNSRWKEMEPHDVVVECAKLTLDYYQENSDCIMEVSTFRKQSSLPSDFSVNEQIKNFSQRTFQAVTSGRERTMDYQKFDSIWSPSTEILATPPPIGTSTVPHTPTPTPSYGVPTVASSSLLDASGASPPEPAVEATPETTPLKDIGQKRLLGSTSHAVRSILTSSQPSSPMRKEQTPFHFPEAIGQIHKSSSGDQTNTTLQRLMQMVNDRHQSQVHLSEESSINVNVSVASTSTYTVEEIHVSSAGTHSRFATLPPIDSTVSLSESAQEDQEITDITSRQLGDSLSDTLQDISPDGEDCDDNERSPCSSGGLHLPASSSIRLFARRVRNRRTYCENDHSSYLSYGTSPADMNSVEHSISVVAKAKVKKTKSWPILPVYVVEHKTYDKEPVNPLKLSIKQKNGQQHIHPKAKAVLPPVYKKEIIQKVTCGTQTTPPKLQAYEYRLSELLEEERKARSKEVNMLQPNEILDQYIEKTVKMKSTDARNREDILRDQINLLHLELQYERYRREIYAERNRRLLGRSRTNRSLEKDNDRLKDQVSRLLDDINELKERSKRACAVFSAEEQERLATCNSWKKKYNLELEDNKQLRSQIDNLQRRLNEEIKLRKEVSTELETIRGELFDTRNEMQQAQFQAEMGNQYKQELQKLQADVLLMGEIQIKCRDKFAELENLKSRDTELEQLQVAYNKELRDLRSGLDMKSSQLETTKARLAELQHQLSSREAMFTDQKRLLKATKEEYQERFDALDKKYENQKAILLQMEEHILLLSKNHKAVNLESEKSEKTDGTSSVDINSPLSHSLASSEGLSASLRSVTELRNLQDLVVQPNTASGETIVAKTKAGAESTASSSSKSNISVMSRQTSGSIGTSASSGGRTSATSLDIPVPGPSHQHSHRRHFSRNQ